MRKCFSIVLTLICLLCGVAHAEGKSLDAAGLIAEARLHVANAGKGLRDAKVDTGARQNLAFLTALRETNAALVAAEKNVNGDAAGYSDTLRELGELSESLPITLRHSGLKSDAIEAGVKGASRSIQALRGQFGPQAARIKAGGALDDREKIELERLKEHHKALISRIATMDTVAHDRGDARMVALLKQLREAAGEDTADSSTAGFVQLLFRVDPLKGAWQSLGLYVDRSEIADWNGLGDEVKAMSTIYGESTKPLREQDLDLLKQKIPLPADWPGTALIEASEVSAILGTISNFKGDGKEPSAGDYFEVDRMKYAPISSQVAEGDARNSSAHESATGVESADDEKIDPDPGDEDADELSDGSSGDSEDDVQEIGEEHLEHDVEKGN